MRRTFLPAVGAAEGAAALARVLAQRGCEVREHGDGANAPASGMRVFRAAGVVQSGVDVAWVLEESAAEAGGWDAALAQALSAQTGGFAVSVETSRSPGRAGYAVFFAGRSIEFISENQAQAAFAEGLASEGVYAAFAQVYPLLTGWPFPELQTWAELKPVAAAQCPAEPAGRPMPDEPGKLALAVFPLVAGDEFSAAWRGVAPTAMTNWTWQAAETATAGIPYVMLTRAGDLDVAVCESLAAQFDVPAAAVGLNGPGAPFDWWRAQPSQRGAGVGAESFAGALMPALSALGERPGIIRLR
ncbi:hypothetical protein [Paraburkholderia unamae]|uniref:hypothetical protein n=1 Tax=Paraburkholderia unamae TaxID=219649 RepID=UPI001CC52030|nr:hypothetical protein [Paraburkholderia unamae]